MSASSDAPILAPFAASAEPPPVQRPPRVWTVFVVFIVAIAGALFVQIAVVIAIVGWQVSRGADVQQVAKELPALLTRPAFFIPIGVATQLAMGLAAIGAARLSPEPTAQRLGWLRPRMPAWGYAAFAFASLLPLALGVAMAEQLAKVLPPDPSVRLLYEQMTVAAAVPFVLFIALGPGFMEELLFRGYMQRRLLRRWSPAVAITVTSLLFGISHGTPHAILAALPLGLWFGVLAWRTGSVWPTIACHALVNGSWNAWHLGSKFAGFPSVSHPAIVAAAVCFGVVGFVASISVLRRG